MKCETVREQLGVYLAEELSAAERQVVQSHLASCDTCRRELRALNELEERARRVLQSKVLGMEPSPQAWQQLQTRLTQAGRPVDGRRGATQSKGVLAQGPTQPGLLARFAERRWRLAWTGLLVVLMAFGSLAVPEVRAMVSQWVGETFHFRTPSGEGYAEIGGFKAFTPYHATYLPAGFELSGIGFIGAPDWEALELTYERDEQFALLIQGKGSGKGPLPQGEAVEVGGLAGVYVADYADSREELERKGLTSFDTKFDYRDVHLLAWQRAEIRFELLSNQPFAEMLRIAEGLTQMEAGQDVREHSSP